MDKIKEKIGQGMEYRKVYDFEVRTAEEDDNDEMWVEGRACVFNQETVLFEYNGIEYKEKIDEKAFTDCEMQDVIFNYNHSGKVFARTRNNTLQLEVKKDGLYMKARLDGTEEGRKIFEEINGKYLDRMSFAFTVKEQSYDSDSHIRTIYKFKKLFDVSVVDFPAYEDTDISARSFERFEKDIKEQEARENKIKRLMLLIEL